MWTAKCYVGSNKRVILDLAKLVLQRRFFSDKAATVGVGPLPFLQKRVDKKELISDKYQLRVAKSLQEVYENIQSYQPEPPSSGSKWFNVFGKDEKRVQAPKGNNKIFIYSV